MTPNLVELIRCPVCLAEGQFHVHAAEHDESEMLKGNIVCADCNESYEVRDGYCDLLRNLSPQVIQERAAQSVIEARELSQGGFAGVSLETERAAVLNLPSGHPEAEEHAPLVRYAIECLGLTGNETVLDLGAGLCWTTAWFAGRGCRCVAVDIHANVLACARHHAAAGVQFDRILADMGDLPLVSGAMDVVFANAALHHCMDLEGTLHGIARVLRPGGRCVLVNEPVVGVFERRRKKQFGLDARRDGINERAYGIQEWRHAFERAGLRARFEIAAEGIAEKIGRRRGLPAYQGFPKREMLRVFAVPAVRNAVLRWCQGPLRFLYPFNVVVWARKP